MFWRKRKPELTEEGPSLQMLATRLGVERRKNLRVRYAPHLAVAKLPEISIEGSFLKIQDISVGGCCLLDPGELLGPSIGQDVELNLHWPSATEITQCRIVSRVDYRRHIQFLNLPRYRRRQLERSMAPGIRGLSLRNHLFGLELGGPALHAAELWSSLLGDSVTLESDVHRIAQIHFENGQYLIYKESWPTKADGKKCSRAEFEQLLLFLSNVPLASQGIRDLLEKLEELLIEANP